MQESSIVEIIKAVLSSGAVNDTHLFLIISLCIVIVIKKITTPFKDTFGKISTKTDIDGIKNDISNVKTDVTSMNNEMENCFKELTDDFKRISEKLDTLSNKAEIHSAEITTLKSDLEQIKKYIDNIYLVSFNKK